MSARPTTFEADPGDTDIGFWHTSTMSSFDDAPQQAAPRFGCQGASCAQGRQQCRDGCNVIPLKPARVQVQRDDEILDWRRRADLPVLTDRVLPASCSTVSTWGHRVVVVLGVAVVAGFAAGYLSGFFQ